MILVRNGYSNNDGQERQDFAWSMVTLCFGATAGEIWIGRQINALTEPERAQADTGEIQPGWYENPIGHSDAIKSRMCSASGLMVPHRLLRWHAGKPYAPPYAPMNPEKI